LPRALLSSTADSLFPPFAELAARETEPVLHFAPWNTLRLLTLTEDALQEHQEESEAEPRAAEEYRSTVGSNFLRIGLLLPLRVLYRIV